MIGGYFQTQAARAEREYRRQMQIASATPFSESTRQAWSREALDNLRRRYPDAATESEAGNLEKARWYIDREIERRRK